MQCQLTNDSSNFQTFHNVMQNANHDFSQNDHSNAIQYYGYFQGFLLSNDNQTSSTKSNEEDKNGKPH